MFFCVCYYKDGGLGLLLKRGRLRRPRSTKKERTLMAMLYEEFSNDYGRCGQVPTRTSRREELLSGYAIHRLCTFKSPKQFKKVCETSSAALADGKQYVAFENVTSKNLVDIEKWREDSNKNLPRGLKRGIEPRKATAGTNR